MNFQNTRRRGEDGIAVVIDFLLSNARLVLGVGGAAILGIATLAVKRVSIGDSFFGALTHSAADGSIDCLQSKVVQGVPRPS